MFHAADCRRVDEVPVRLRNCVDLIPRWKLVFVWTAIRRSLQSVPSVYNRTQLGLLLTTHEKAAPGEQNGICFHFAKRGHCRRGKACKFRHVERPTQAMVRQKHQKDRQNRKVPPGHYRRLNAQQGKGAGNAQKTGACHNCGKRGHWARDCRAPKVERANVTNDW